MFQQVIPAGRTPSSYVYVAEVKGASLTGERRRFEIKAGIWNIPKSIIAQYAKRRIPLFAKTNLADTFAQSADIE